MSDKIKRDARARQAATGEPYTRARRAAAGQAPPPAGPDDAPAAEGVPQPVAVMMARHLQAAMNHLGRWTSLGQEAMALPESPRLGEKPKGPAAPVLAARSEAHRILYHLQQWTERTAVASGAVPVMPELFGPVSPEGRAARKALYPEPLGWCADGGHLPQPGETPEDTAPGRAARHCLPGPVPDWHLSRNARGMYVRRAGDIVPGTPAAPLFDAAGRIEAYASGWAERPGDSPADLAAALDGFSEVVSVLTEASTQLLREIARRAANGTLSGVDAAQLAAAREKLTAVLDAPVPGGGSTNHLNSALRDAAGAITGASARPRPDAPPVPGHLARKLAGKTAAQVREELGSERFVQRQVSRVRPGDYTRADHLEAVATWMHATGAAAYDPGAHSRDVS
jgi:hypothetical protein